MTRKTQAQKDIKALNSRVKNLDAISKQQLKDLNARTAELVKTAREKEKVLISKGLYNPRIKDLTPSRAKTIARKFKANEQFLSDKFFFVPAPKTKAAKKVLERAKSLEMKTTKTGFFFEKEGHISAKLAYDRKSKEYALERQGKTKKGPNAGRVYKSTIPLAPLDALDNERARLTRMANKNPLKSDKERYAFKVVENGIEGYSRRTFSRLEDLFTYLDTYRKKTAAKVNFFRHIEIEHVQSSDKWFKDHPRKNKKRKVLANGRNA